MQIIKTPQGYLVQPQTDREEKALDIVMLGLSSGNTLSNPSTCCPASHSHPSGQTQHTDCEAE